MKFVALLRGVNVGGKNKVVMSDLKACFEDAGFDNVRTYINSGNVVFESAQTDATKLVAICENAIRTQCGFDVVCAVISADELAESLRHAPAWWGEAEGKHNAIFAIAPKKAEEIMAEIGDAKPEYEKVAAYHPIIFWSAPIETFSRTRYSKIVGTKVYQFVTIRNLSTTKKIADMCREV